jgi:hypothetical protein
MHSSSLSFPHDAPWNPRRWAAAASSLRGNLLCGGCHCQEAVCKPAAPSSPRAFLFGRGTVVNCPLVAGLTCATSTYVLVFVLYCISAVVSSSCQRTCVKQAVNTKFYTCSTTITHSARFMLAHTSASCQTSIAEAAQDRETLIVAPAAPTT